ncbi:ferrous iron transport protein B [Hippea maritima]|uniref:Ferrous iron transport protein B n=1 Tax=Hippea maritima (strain ATCC 700847 / DSM 10411 / MH2) TaxID=760142 RepID=F2LVN9_HIPMA|nr:ferrous iron transport protein B [Hippea maritima]AEA33823.1 ferrous iron transport protein B [Hippea maritima DSM 10411]
MNIAFAGNPNVGKTAIINAIAGSKLKVGNWPGVTVEKKEAEVEFKGKTITLTDLPGVYSLSPYSIEERITRDFIFEQDPDCIVNVIDSTNIERNLYLTLLLMETEKPLIIALNMFDEFKKLGYEIDLEGLSEMLGVKVVPTSAIKREGLQKLMEISISCPKEHKKLDYKLRYDGFLESEIMDVVKKLKQHVINTRYPLRWIAIKLLERDEYAKEKLKKELGMDISKLADENIKRIEERFGDDAETVLAESRYGIINGILKKVFKKTKKDDYTITEKLDKIFISKSLGIPIFLLFMYLTFKFTFDGSAPFIDWFDGFVNDYIAKYISLGISQAPDWLKSLLIDGILGGVGLVLSFLPLMFFLYFFLALLEESGYMARAAFLMDRVMSSLGLNGKAFIPMILGFGCNVPAIYATRALERETDRKLTAVMVPFMSCGARLPIYALFTAVFFSTHRATVVLSLYLLGIAVAFMVGLILRKTEYFKEDKAPLLLELPPYRLPTLSMIWASVWARTKAFIVKAGTVIALAMVLLWGVIYLPANSSLENSILGKTAKAVSFVFKPAGFDDWRIVASIIPGVIAKETVVGALSQTLKIHQDSEDNKQSSNFLQDTKEQIAGFFQAIGSSFKSMFLSFSQDTFELESFKNSYKDKLSKIMTPLSSFSFMVFMLLFIPCIVTLAAIKQEFGWGLMVFEIGLLAIVPYIISVIIYQGGKLLGFD